ncbi:hypothetical protein F4778DRAFT_713582 [Xylariomycetidae sp. FL2044]|nr:hypothetical protein F4778DRAFT_713582 [Xylariomycetidae sp. FL2044]
MGNAVLYSPVFLRVFGVFVQVPQVASSPSNLLLPWWLSNHEFLQQQQGPSPSRLAPGAPLSCRVPLIREKKGGDFSS